MAFLLRLRTTHTLATPSPSLSLLHHHRHLSSTFNSVSYFVCRNQFPILTFTNPSLPLLHHHRRLLPTSHSGSGDHPNSNHPSPSLVRELREAIEQLSAREYVFATPFIDNLSLFPSPASQIIMPSIPASSTFPSPPPSFNSKEEEAEQNVPPAIDNKLQQLKMSALSLRHRQNTDKQRIWEMDQSRIAFIDKVLAELELDEHSKLGNENENGTLILQFTWLKDRTMEFVELSKELYNSRLASLYEIVEKWSQLREDFQDDQVWNELNEALMRVKEMEMKDFELLALDEQVSIVHHINDLCGISHKHG